MREIIIVCDDLFGLDTYSILEETNAWDRNHERDPRYRILGFISDSESPFGDRSSGMQRLGSIQDWKPIGEERYVLGIADPERKKAVVALLQEQNACFETVLAPWALALPEKIQIGEGSLIAAYSMKDGLKVGKFVTMMAPMMAARSVGDYSTILRFSNIIGNVGANTFVGNHVFLASGKTIGDDCFVEDGSIVIKNIKSGNRAAGVPARKVKGN